ncbi:hypothetical protein JIR001_31650 [Polycladomyces abyssicola]|uniref:Uncharacterized protein n=1 Tax=Polycladomyces abyssicola TaxID=1125966 RepID=A0A8D5UH78_9BACL|nr:hypothetical protein [Polycladomyces abyssicola]BCU83382.1 hypothetical protein JIR001_31650 [Polycladomyces abyssicola]
MSHEQRPPFTLENRRWAEWSLGAELADVKQMIYHDSLLITALIEELIDKRVITREELVERTCRLDQELLSPRQQNEGR